VSIKSRTTMRCASPYLRPRTCRKARGNRPPACGFQAIQKIATI
jgi:hypothetical protein